LLSVCQNPDATAFVAFKSKSFKIKSWIRNTEENIKLTHGEVIELIQGWFLPLIIDGPPANEVHSRQHEDVLQLA
jgi:hypothetical protein